MSLQPIQQEQVQQTLQVVLAYLEDEHGVTPNAMVDGIVSGKSLLRGILSGQLLVCQNVAAPAGPGPVVIEDDMPQEPKDAIAAKQAEDEDLKEDAPKSLGDLIAEEEEAATEKLAEADAA